MSDIPEFTPLHEIKHIPDSKSSNLPGLILDSFHTTFLYFPPKFDQQSPQYRLLEIDQKLLDQLDLSKLPTSPVKLAESNQEDDDTVENTQSTPIDTFKKHPHYALNPLPTNSSSDFILKSAPKKPLYCITPTQTLKLTQILSSNLTCIIPPFGHTLLGDWPKSLPSTLSTNVFESLNMSPYPILSTVTQLYQLELTFPKLEKLWTIMKENLFSIDNDDLEQAIAQKVYSSTNNNSGELSHQPQPRFKGYSLEYLVNRIQASPNEIVTALWAIQAMHFTDTKNDQDNNPFKGTFMRLDPNFHFQVLEALISFCKTTAIDPDISNVEFATHHLERACESTFSFGIFHHVFTLHTIPRQFGKTFVFNTRACVRTSSHPLFLTLQKWPTSKFVNALYDIIPSTFAPIAQLYDILSGIAVFVFSSNSTKKKSFSSSSQSANPLTIEQKILLHSTIEYLPTWDLPFSLKERVAILFSLKPVWTFVELEPFIAPVVPPNQSVESFCATEFRLFHAEIFPFSSPVACYTLFHPLDV